MTTDEMQRFLNEEAGEGKGELETYRKFLRILGLIFPGEKENGKKGE